MAQVMGVGIDAVDISRVRTAHYFERLTEYILRKEEHDLMRASRDPIQFLASRLAMKEAVIKAFPQPLNLQEVSVTGYGCRPQVHIIPTQVEAYRIDVSLTHTLELAIGVALVVRS